MAICGRVQVVANMRQVTGKSQNCTINCRENKRQYETTSILLQLQPKLFDQQIHNYTNLEANWPAQ